MYSTLPIPQPNHYHISSHIISNLVTNLLPSTLSPPLQSRLSIIQIWFCPLKFFRGSTKISLFGEAIRLSPHNLSTYFAISHYLLHKCTSCSFNSPSLHVVLLTLILLSLTEGFLCTMHYFKPLIHINSHNPHFSSMSLCSVIMPILQRRKLKHRRLNNMPKVPWLVCREFKPK